MRVLDPRMLEVVERQAPPLCVCKWCKRTNVWPEKWQTNKDGSAKLHLVCPDCCMDRWVYAAKHQVEAFDDFLNDSTEMLVIALSQLARQNLEEDIEDLIQAIWLDNIMPIDF